MENKLCVALGDFDGVHLGHRRLLDVTVNNPYGFIPAVYTFNGNCKGAKVIMTGTEKRARLTELGVKRIIFDDFEKVRRLSPQEFAENVLFKRLNAGAVVCGMDFRFGRNADGDIGVLTELCRSAGVFLLTVDCLAGQHGKLSSSDIRLMIRNGQMEKAAAALGSRFFVTGTVSHGKRLGSRHNTPTVNIKIDAGRIVPKYSVYITQTVLDGKKYNGITNVGVRPSVEDTDIANIETNLFDFDAEIYGSQIRVEFIKMLRSERKFESRELLFSQIAADIAAAKAYFDGEKE